jgi:putative ABC transport system permease protein
MTGLLGDVRLAIRQHVRQPGFGLTVVCTLGITIGATTAVFSVVNAVLVRALPFAAADRLVWIASVRPDNPNAPFTLPEYIDYRSQTQTVSGMAAYAGWSASLSGDGVTERLSGARMSANAFEVLGVSPAAGRLLTEADDRSDAAPVVILSNRLWQRQYGGSPDAVGRTLRINGERFVVIGVLPARFPLPLRDIDVVTALVPDRDPLRYARGSVNFLRLFGRLSPGIDAARAQAELTAICRSLRQQFPVEYARKDAVNVTALGDAIVGDSRRPMLLLLVAVVVVFATALANLVSLSLVRANGRRPEMALRLAVGASRRHLARQLSVEGLILAAVGSGIGWSIAAAALAIGLRWVPPSVPRLNEVGVDGRIIVFVSVMTAAVTALLTAAPLGAFASTQDQDALRSSRGTIGGRWNHRVRQTLVVAEISAALVLLLATIVLVQNLRRLDEVHLGFSADDVFQARVSVPPAYRSTEDLARFYERLSDRLAAAPGVEQVGVISVAPMTGLLSTVPFAVEGDARDRREVPNANFRVVSPGYLEAAGTRLLRGRGFTENDRLDTPHVALVSTALADRFLSGNAVGRRLLINDNNEGPRPVEIVGVIENVRQAALDVPAAFDIYLPLRQLHPDNVALLRNNQFWTIKTASDPSTFRATFLAQLRAIDPDAAVSSTGPLRQYVDDWLGPRRFNLGLFSSFALTAILLSVSGLYGLVAYTVNQRTPEIGLRMAVGATEGQVRRMILRQAALLGVIGAAVGTCIAAAVRPLASSAIPDVTLSPTVVAATAATILGTVLIAAWLPARRAARIEPTIALKA